MDIERTGILSPPGWRNKLAQEFTGEARYQSLWTVSRGGSGEVTCAMQRGSMGFRRLVAIKRLHTTGSNPEALDALIREARLGGMLRHKNLVAVYDLDQDQDGYFQVMEFVEGHTFRELLELARRETLLIPPEAAFEMIAEAAAGLHHAHTFRDEAGQPLSLVHCDIKPENLMVSQDGQVKVLDLGLARIRSVEGLEGLTRALTPAYASPEQLAGQAMDASSDLFSLGTVLFELLTGTPFRPASGPAHALRPDNPATLARLEALEDALAGARPLLQSLLQPDPSARLSSAEVLIQQLRALGAQPEALIALTRQLPAAPSTAPSASHPASAPHLNQRIPTQVHTLASGGEAAFVAAIGLAPDDPQLSNAEALGGESLEFEGGCSLVAFGERSSALQWMASLLQSPPAQLSPIAVGASWGALRADAEAPGQWAGGVSLAVLLAGNAQRGSGLITVSLLFPETEAPEAAAEKALEVDDLAGSLTWERLGRYRPQGWGQTVDLLHVLPPGAPQQNSQTVAGRYEGGGRPFRSLASFDQGNAELYFGRDAEITELETRLSTHSLVTLTSPSGGGKTSLLKAGLLSRLKDKDLRCLWIRPESAPLLRMRAYPGPDAPDPVVDPEGWATWFVRGAQQRKQDALLIVDQAEELLTLCLDADMRVKATRAFIGIVDAGGRVLLSVRADFFAALVTTGALRGRAADSVMVLPPPDDAMLRAALVSPLKHFGYSLDEAVIVDILTALRGNPGGLALLQVCADRMWELRDRLSKRLTWAHYDAVGRVQGAIADHADGVMNALSQQERLAVRRLMGGLITEAGTRRPLSFSRAARLVGVEAGGAGLVDKLVASRLLVVTDGNHNEPQVEIVHEALISHWKTLGHWRAEDLAQLQLQADVRRAAEDWDRRGRPRGMLWSEELLAELKRWDMGMASSLEPLEGAFIERSHANARRRRMGTIGILLGLLLVLSAASVWAVYQRQLTEDSAAGAEAARLEAQQNLELAEQRAFLQQAALERSLGHDHLAIQIAREQLEAHPDSTEALRELILAAGPQRALAILVGHTGAVDRVAFSADGQTLLTSSQDDTSRLWDRSGHARAVLAGQFGVMAERPGNSAGPLIATGSVEGTLYFWNARGEQQTKLKLGQQISALAWNPAQDRLAVGTKEGIAALLTQKGDILSRFSAHSGHILSIDWSASGTTFFTAGIGTAGNSTGSHGAPSNGAPSNDADDNTVIREWTSDGKPTGRMTIGQPNQQLFFYASDGHRVLTSTWGDGELLWDFRTGKAQSFPCTHRFPLAQWQPGAGGRSGCAKNDPRSIVVRGSEGAIRHTLTSPSNTIRATQWSPDGKRLATLGDDGQLALWTDQGIPLNHFQAHAGAALVAGWSRDGSLLATGGVDGTTRIWDGFGRAPRTVSCPGNVTHASLSPDGQNLFVAFAAPGPSRWGARIVHLQNRLEVELPPSAQPIRASAWHPNGTLLATRDDDDRVTLWSAHGKRLHLLEGTPVARLAWNQDGSYLAVLRQTGSIGLYSPNGTLVQEAADAHAKTMAWAPGGKRLASAAPGGRITLRSAPELKPLRTLLHHSKGDSEGDSGGDSDGDSDGHAGANLMRLCWHPQGDRLVAVSEEGWIQIWNPDGPLIAEVQGGKLRLADCAWTLDGQRFATAGWDSQVRTWDPEGKPLQTLQGHLRPVHHVAWAPDGSHILSGGWDTTARLWDAQGHSIAVLTAHPGELVQTDWSPDGRAVLTWSNQDPDVILWPVTRDALLAEANRLLPGPSSSAVPPSPAPLAAQHTKEH